MSDISEFIDRTIKNGLDGFYKLPPDKQTESDARDSIVSALSPSFDIQHEVLGTHFTGRRNRVDLVIKPKDASQWLNPNIAFAIELKNPNYGDETGACCKHFGQSFSYLETDWDGYGYLYVLTYPACLPSFLCDRDRGFFHRLVGRIGIGFLSWNHWNGISITVNEHTIWCKRLGVVEGRFWKLERKFGAR